MFFIIFFFYSTSFFFISSETNSIWSFGGFISIFSSFLVLGFAIIFLLTIGFFWITFFDSYFFKGTVFFSFIETFLFIIFEGIFSSIFVLSSLISSSYSIFGCELLFFEKALQVKFYFFVDYFLWYDAFGVSGLFFSFWGVTLGNFMIACCSRGEGLICIKSDKSLSFYFSIIRWTLSFLGGL